MLSASRIALVRRRVDQSTEAGAFLMGLITLIISSVVKAQKENDNDVVATVAGFLLFFSLLRILGVSIGPKVRACMDNMNEDQTERNRENHTFYMSRISRLLRGIMFTFSHGFLLIALSADDAKNDTLQSVTKLMLVEALLTVLKQFLELSLYHCVLSGCAQDERGSHPLDYFRDRRHPSAVLNAVIKVVARDDWSKFKLLAALPAPLDVDVRFKPEAEDMGFGPLHIAVANQCEELVAALLVLGANPQKYDRKGRLPLEYALLVRNYAIFSMLLPRTDVRPDPSGTDPKLRLVLSLILPQPRRISCVLDRPAHDEYTAIAMDENEEETSAIQALTELQNQGGPINLNELAFWERICSFGDARTIRIWQRLGFNFLNPLHDDHGNTALHIAALAEMPNIRAMRALLDLGLPHDARNNEGLTALAILAPRIVYLRAFRGDELQQQIRDADAMIEEFTGGWRKRRAPIIAAALAFRFCSEESTLRAGAAGAGAGVSTTVGH